MKALRKITIQDKTFYVLKWDEAHGYQKTSYYLRDGNWKFVSSLWESRNDPDLFLFDINKVLYGSTRLSTGETTLFDRSAYWSLSKPLKRAVKGSK